MFLIFECLYSFWNVAFKHFWFFKHLDVNMLKKIYHDSFMSMKKNVQLLNDILTNHLQECDYSLFFKVGAKVLYYLQYYFVM